MIPYQAPPCYNQKTKKDYERRCAGCATSCPEWAMYEEYKARKYAQQAHNRISADFAMETIWRVRNQYKNSDKIKAALAYR